jgi:AcrR family transcriptional regulator
VTKRATERAEPKASKAKPSKRPATRAPRRVREVVRDETRAAYREAILDAAFRVFGRLGFHAAKMADIAAEAGVAAGTLYNYFENKDEVFRSIMVRGHDEIYRRLLADEPIADPLQRMRAWMHSVYSFLEEHGVLFSTYVRFAAIDWLQKNDLDALHDETHARYHALSRVALEEAAARGLVRRDISSDELATLLGGLSDATIFAWARAGCPPGLRAKADPMFDFFLNGARAP